MKKHTHSIRRGDRTYNVCVVEDDIGYTIDADLDPEYDPDDPHLIHTGGISEIVHAFAKWQASVPDVTEDPVVSFEDEASGQLIVNPWYDSTLRFPHTTVDAIRMYGVQNVAKFVTDVITFLFDIKEEA